MAYLKTGVPNILTVCDKGERRGKRGKERESVCEREWTLSLSEHVFSFILQYSA